MGSNGDLLVLSRNTIVIATSILGIAALIGILVFKIVTFGRSSDDYSTVCIKGHEYWQATFVYHGFLSIKLDPEGKPIPCDTK